MITRDLNNYLLYTTISPISRYIFDRISPIFDIIVLFSKTNSDPHFSSLMHNLDISFVNLIENKILKKLRKRVFKKYPV